MKVANIAKVKNQLSQYLEYVKRGGTVRILDRNHAVADLIPIGNGMPKGKGDRERLENLEAKGIIKRGTGSISKELLTPPSKSEKHPKGEHGILEAHLKERRESR